VIVIDHEESISGPISEMLAEKARKPGESDFSPVLRAKMYS
jgi:hypothetical protein